METMNSKTERKWLLPAVITGAVLCLIFMAGRFGPPAKAYAQLQASTDSGISAIPVQLTRDSYGLAMVDMASQTIWVYEIDNRSPAHNRLRLLAARSWKYDRMLENYNTADPKPEQVKMMLEKLTQHQKPQNSEIQEMPEEQQQEQDVNIIEIAEPNNGS
ncbi:MAG: hypothetical protein NTW55_01490 [Planctomycetota bacterium]|nr:hypothetical protein [Planctomycetota bacterium]